MSSHSFPARRSSDLPLAQPYDQVVRSQLDVKDEAAFDHANISDTSTDALVHVGDAFFAGVQLFAIPLVLATALATLRYGPLPRGFGWASAVLALILAIPPVGWLGVYLGLPLWVLLLSVLLYREHPAATLESTP